MVSNLLMNIEFVLNYIDLFRIKRFIVVLVADWAD